MEFSKEAYKKMIETLFERHQSVQSKGFTSDSYKPGLAGMEAIDELLGHPWRSYKIIHVAGTNGKGSVASMLCSAMSAAVPASVGLYTSPHIYDFRERMRVLTSSAELKYISEEYVWDFIQTYGELIDKLGLSFFEITTALAFKWFADIKVDYAIIETGLGGRLDSTNIVTPVLSVISSIGLDHCAILGSTRAEIAAEKGGIIKPGVPVVIGERDEETSQVFERIASLNHSPIYFASASSLSATIDSHLRSLSSRLDLRGDYQVLNLRTSLVALSVLNVVPPDFALENAAARTGLRARWELVHSSPDVICDIGHNPPAMQKNVDQLQRYLREGTYDSIIILYGAMADKDITTVLGLMPRNSTYVLVAPASPRALPLHRLLPLAKATLSASGDASGSSPAPSPEILTASSVSEGLRLAMDLATTRLPARTLVFVGGSTFVVSEALESLSPESF